MPRPAVDVASLLPDFTEELRWPLAPSVHPDLEPAFPVAAQLAQPGVTWHDLCAMGAQHRHVPGPKAQLVAYLGAWCSAAAHDDEKAIARLSSLGTTTIDGLAEALPIDLADILADVGNADADEHLIEKYELHDVAVLDDLAAVFLELGQPDAARAINNDALELGAQSREADQCHRAARDILLAPSAARDLKIQDLKRAHVTDRKVPDPTCVSLSDALECYTYPASRCSEYLKAQRLDWRYASLLTAYYHWPADPTGYYEWRALAREAASASGLPGSAELTDAALAGAVQTSECDPELLSELRKTAIRSGGPAQQTLHAAISRRCPTSLIH